MRFQTSKAAFFVALNFIAALFALAATTGAMAAETTIGGVSITLPPPAGFCELTERNPSDNKVLTNTGALLTKTGNKLLGMSADCQQLADWRASRRPYLDDYGQYQTVVASMDQLVASPEAEIQTSCASLRTEGQQIASDQAPSLKKAFETTLEKIRLNETKFIGVFVEDKTACYAGLVTKIKTEGGTEKTQAVLFAIAVIHNKDIFVYRMAPYIGSDPAINATLTKLKGDVAALYAANK